MKIILRKDVEKLGRTGEVKDVARGYARNYLLSRGLALEATPQSIRWFEQGQEKRQKLREKLLAEALEICKKLASVSLSFSRPAGEQGKLFGSVGKSDIVSSLKASGYTVDRNAVQLESVIKQVGDYDVEIRLAPGASTKVKVSVVARS